MHFSSHNTGEKYQINYFVLTIYRDSLFNQKSLYVMRQHISSCIARLPVKRRQATSQTNSQCNQDSSSMFMCHYNRMHHKGPCWNVNGMIRYAASSHTNNMTKILHTSIFPLYKTKTKQNAPHHNKMLWFLK